MKNNIHILLLLLLLLPCNAAATTPVDDRKVLTVRGDYNYPPFEYLNKDGIPEGFNIDIIRAVSRAMGMKLNIDLGPWDQVRRELEDGKIDALAGMYSTLERDKKLDFSVPHFISTYAVFVRKDSSITGIEDCRGKQVIVQKGDLGHDFVVENRICTEPVLEDNWTDVIKSLSRGKGDCAVISRLQGLYLMEKLGIKNLRPVGSTIIQRKYCIAVTEGNSNLLAEFNEGLFIIKTSGELDRIFEKWFEAYKTSHLTVMDVLKRNMWLIAPLIFLVIAGFLWSWMLRVQVNRKTASLYHELRERRRAEQEKLNAQKIAGDHEKLALVGQIAAEIAHDFNNILSIIMGNAELSLLDCREAETRKTLKLILEQTIRGKSLTRNFMAFARDQEPKQESFGIDEKIEMVLSLLKKDLADIELKLEKEAQIPNLIADPGMIEHAIVNLIQNSIHALSMTVNPLIIIRTYCRNGFICCEIEDNGCGIAKEHMKDIFKPAFTLKGRRDAAGSYRTSIKGTGYGMPNVKKYIEKHDGKISIDSAPGSGTRVIIRIPLIEGKLIHDKKGPETDHATGYGKSVLIVEDEPSISRIHEKILTSPPFNHKVEIAISGSMAAGMLEKNSYDLISLDHILSGKMTGMDLYHHIRRRDKETPILFASGNIEFLESIKALREKDPLVDHLTKPFSGKVYADRVNSMVRIKP